MRNFNSLKQAQSGHYFSRSESNRKLLVVIIFTDIVLNIIRIQHRHWVEPFIQDNNHDLNFEIRYTVCTFRKLH